MRFDNYSFIRKHSLLFAFWQQHFLTLEANAALFIYHLFAAIDDSFAGFHFIKRYF